MTVGVRNSLFSGALIVVPGQQLVDAIDLVFRNEGKDVRQPSPRIDLIELGCFAAAVALPPTSDPAKSEFFLLPPIDDASPVTGLPSGWAARQGPQLTHPEAGLCNDGSLLFFALNGSG